MGSMGSLTKMISGLQASQRGLQVTSHNLSNVNTEGYTRQQLLQHDSRYLNISTNQYLKQVGTGVSMTEVRQIRSELGDTLYRSQNGNLQYYGIASSAMEEIEAIMDEPNGAALSSLINSFWLQTQKLATNPGGLEERLTFLQSADVMIKRTNQIMDSLKDYQNQLDTQIVENVDRINELVEGIREYNEKIATAESRNENANDYRDMRNNYLDELSGYLNIEYYEQSDKRVSISVEGRTLLNKQHVGKIEVRANKTDSGFMEPVWESTGEKVFKFNKSLSPIKNRDSGKLQSLLMVRGEEVVNADTPWDKIAFDDTESVDLEGNGYVIPMLQKKLATFVKEVVNTLNEQLSGEGMGTHKGLEGIPLFVPIMSEYTQPEPPVRPGEEATEAELAEYEVVAKNYEVALKGYKADIKSELLLGNIQVNPLLLTEGGYNRLGLTPKGTDNIGDNTIVTKMLADWQEPREWFKEGKASDPYTKVMSLGSFFSEYTAEIGLRGGTYRNKTEEYSTSILNIENSRKSINAVSQDEELANMLKYQHAYNASARMITVMDGMMDTLINKMF